MNNPIVVPYDGSEFSKRAFPLAVELARRANAPLHIVRVHLFSIPALEPQIEPPYTPDFLSELLAYEREDLEKVRQELQGRGVVAVSALLTAGLVVPLLRDYIAQHTARCVVMTTHGRGGFNAMWLGSVASGLVRSSPKPVILIPIKDAAEPEITVSSVRHVLVALDGSSRAEQIIPSAVDIAHLFQARVTLLQIVPAVRVTEGFHPLAAVTGSTERTKAEHAAADVYLLAVADRLRTDGLEVQVETRKDWQNTAHAILAVAEELNADLVAVSTHGRGAWSRMVIGSVADKVIRSARVRVLAWHAPEPGEAQSP
jgi:nucleotide-binding universal stress UspA family protein